MQKKEHIPRAGSCPSFSSSTAENAQPNEPGMLLYDSKKQSSPMVFYANSLEWPWCSSLSTGPQCKPHYAKFLTIGTLETSDSTEPVA